MPEQGALFKVAPSRLFVAARWTRWGWNVSITASVDSEEGAASHTASYELLSPTELLDVITAELGSALGE
jgi:hypothetical protein